ncbi:hypothetical protein V6N11_044891 [Hibiscus sabdariffa]|uniref:Uncharacterized protein n=1 Tax=Hibiscus sabdariffa TaxID=183260 RepID=A0ABR2PUR2_9ROSI
MKNKRLDVFQVLFRMLRKKDYYKEVMNQKEEDGSIALYITASNNKPQVLKLILESKIDKHVANQDGVERLLSAISSVPRATSAGAEATASVPCSARADNATRLSADSRAVATEVSVECEGSHAGEQVSPSMSVGVYSSATDGAHNVGQVSSPDLTIAPVSRTSTGEVPEIVGLEAPANPLVISEPQAGIESMELTAS